MSLMSPGNNSGCVISAWHIRDVAFDPEYIKDIVQAKVKQEGEGVVTQSITVFIRGPLDLWNGS